MIRNRHAWSRRLKWSLVVASIALLLLGWLALRAFPSRPTHEHPPMRAAATKAGPTESASEERRAPPLPLTPATVAPVKEAAAKPGALQGRVLSVPDGRGISGAELTFERNGAANTTRTGADGRFTFVPSEAGDYRLAAVIATGYLPYAPEWGHSGISFTAVPGRALEEVVLYLEAARQYRGEVVDVESKPIAGAEVRVIDPGEGKSALTPITARFTSDANGQLTFSVPPGALLEATHPGYSPGRARVPESRLAPGDVTFTLTPANGEASAPAAKIEGTVLDVEGVAAEGAGVSARREFWRDGRREPRLSPEPSAVADANGHFVLPGLDDGSYALNAALPGAIPAEASGVVAGTRDLVLRLTRGGVLRGRVTDARTGAPVPSFTVSVARRDGPLRREEVASQSQLDADGRFALDGLPDDALAVTVAAHGYATSAEVAVSGPAPGATVTVDLKLERGGRVIGKVVDRASQAPIAGAQISTEGQLGSEGSVVAVRASATSDARGEFTLPGLSAGRRSILVEAAEHHARILSGLAVENGGDVGPLVVALTPTQPGEDPRIEMVGIGAVLQARDDVLVITQVLPGGGAAVAQLVAGDQVLAVEGVAVAGLGFSGAIERIRGPEDSVVQLRVRKRDGEAELDLAVPRKQIRN